MILTSSLSKAGFVKGADDENGIERGCGRAAATASGRSRGRVDVAARRAAAKRAMATVQRRMTKVLVRVLGVYELWRIGDEDDNLCCFNMEKNGKDHSVINHVCLLLGEEEKKIDYLPNIVIR